MDFSQHIAHLQDLASFAIWVSMLVIPSIAVAKSRIPSLKGWRTLATSASIACLVVGALVSPQTLRDTLDCLLVGLMAAVIASGGDTYVLRLIGKAKRPPSLPEPVFPREAPTQPDIRRTP